MKANQLSIILGLIFISLFPAGGVAQTLGAEIEAIADIVVDIDGTGDYTSVKEALAAIPDSSNTWTVVYIKNGFYYEKIVLAAAKTKVVLVGENVDSTVLSYDDHADAVLPGHTFSSYSFRADAHDFQAYNLTFENTNVTSQAVAFHSNGDRQILYHCKFLGNQDTYFDNFRTRRYIKDCYLEGDVDFIFGFGVTLFEDCHIHANDPGYLTAAATPEHYEFGYVFKNSVVTVREGGFWSVSLGRPWFDYSNTIFFESWLHERIIPAGWSPWGGREATCIYREYNNVGPGAPFDDRVEWSSQLDPALAPRYNVDTIFAASNFPSNLGPEVDSIELWSMRKRFEDSGYAERADTILYAGRDYWPSYPTDNWSPEFYQPVYGIVTEYTDFFISLVDTSSTTSVLPVPADRSITIANPVRDQLILEVDQALSGEVSLMLYDAAGQVVMRKKWFGLPAGTTHLPLTADLYSGIYYYQIAAPGLSETGKLLINPR